MVKGPDERFASFLNAFPIDPLKLPSIIHIAGTNGKGGTLFYLKKLLEEAGKKVHIFTSPHLEHVYERIWLAGKMISPEFYHLLEAKVIPLIENEFDRYMGIALLAFQRVEADYLLLETGLGGRLDATNLSQLIPKLIIFTPISLDHQEILGNKIEAIINEKTAICKKDVPILVAAQAHKNFIESKALGRVVPLVAKGENIFKKDVPFIHQENFRSALTAFRFLEPESFICQSSLVQKAHWPGRMQNKTQSFRAYFELDKIDKGEEDAGHKKHIFWLDGAHNQGGFEAIRRFLPEAYIVPHFKKDAGHKCALLKMQMKNPYLLYAPEGGDFFPIEQVRAYCAREKISYSFLGSFEDFQKFLTLNQTGQFVFCGSLEVSSFYLNKFRA